MVYLSEQECSCYVVLPWWHWWFSRSMYTGILSVGKNPGENPISFKVYVCCIFGFQEKNGQRMSKVHLSGSQRCILNWPQVIFPNFKHRTSDLTFSLSRSMFIERSVNHYQSLSIPSIHLYVVNVQKAFKPHRANIDVKISQRKTNHHEITNHDSRHIGVNTDVFFSAKKNKIIMKSPLKSH